MRRAGADRNSVKRDQDVVALLQGGELAQQGIARTGRLDAGGDFHANVAMFLPLGITLIAMTSLWSLSGVWSLAVSAVAATVRFRVLSSLEHVGRCSTALSQRTCGFSCGANARL